jgi:hypothetical protein
MSERSKTVVFAICVLAVAVLVLSMIGLRVGASWQTFVPDLLVGVITAGGIAGGIAWVQVSSDHRRAQADAITRAYEDVLDSLGELQLADLTDRDTSRLMSRVGVKMINFVERSEPDDGDMTLWFEAERRYLRYLALTCAMSFDGADGPMEREVKSIPFRKHVQELVANIRRGRLADISLEVREQATLIEKKLRDEGRWDDAATGT